MKKTILLLLAMSGCTVTPAHAAPDFPHRGRAGVVDAAHVLTPKAAAALNDQVVRWDRTTGHQFVVATVPDMQGLDVKTYGYQLGRAWGLGDKHRNDGVILLLAMKEHKARIEVGYGLEAVLTDAATSAILANSVVPKLRTGDVDGALTDGANAIMTVAQSEPVAASSAALPSSGPRGIIAGALTALGTAFGFGWLVRRRRARQTWAAAAKEALAKPAQVRQAEPAYRLISTPETERRYRSPTWTPAPTPPSAFYTSPRPTPSPSPSPSPSSSGSSSYDYGSSSSSGWSDSSSSSSGFDSGGGSFGGGGSDSSW